MAVTAETASGGVAWFRDERRRALVFQLVTLVSFVALVIFLANNMLTSMSAKGLAFGFDFLNSTSGFDISFMLSDYNAATSNHWDVFYIGLLNTLLLSALAIVTSTVIGGLFGVLRLSRNWLISRLVYVYIEVFRNVPLLLVILMCAAIFQYLPQLRDALQIGDYFYLSNRGVEIPSPTMLEGFWLTPAFLLFGIVVSFFIRRWARARQAATGQPFPAGLVSLGLIVALPVAVFLVTGMPLDLEPPTLKGFNFINGINIPPAFMALWLALTLYTAAFTAETVRSGIEAVNHGQTEAAYSLGLRPGRTLRLVVIPQALRVMVPPMTSEYLSLVKNTSLGVAIAYPDVVSVFAGTSLNQTGHAVEILGITMAFYLSVSLIISLLMNWYNKRIALVER